MLNFGRFLAGSNVGITEVRKLAHEGGCFISTEPALKMPGCFYVTIWAPSFCLWYVSDARSHEYLGQADAMSDACLWSDPPP